MDYRNKGHANKIKKKYWENESVRKIYTIKEACIRDKSDSSSYIITIINKKLNNKS